MLEKIPRSPDMHFGRAEVADREPQREPPVEPGVRDEDLSASVDGFEKAFVESVGRDRAAKRRPGAKTDDAEGDRGETLELRRPIDPGCEQSREPHVLADPLTQT